MPTVRSVVIALSLFGSALALPQSAEANFSKATFSGKPAACPKGSHYSPRKDGQCWACPAGMKRTLLPIAGKKACKRKAKTSWSKSKRHAREIRRKDGCPRGQFWRGKGGKGFKGACYSCPRSYKPTVLSVTGRKACKKTVKAKHTRAKFVKEWGCPKGAYFSPRKGGQCWSCPAGWHRTVSKVTGKKACAKRLVDVFAVEKGGMCKFVLGAIRGGSVGTQKVKDKMAKLTAPLTKPIQAVMKKIVPPIDSPRQVNQLINKTAAALKPYQQVPQELSRVGSLALRNPGKLGNILLNQNLMCGGNKKQIIRSLVAAGLNPNFRARRAGLMDRWNDGLFIRSAHAAGGNRPFHALFMSSGTRKVGKPVGLGIGVTVITDLQDHLRLYYSFPSLFVSRIPGYEFTVGYMIFPSTNIDNFNKINALGVEISLGRGDSPVAPTTALQKILKKWPSGLGFNVSFDPAFVKSPRDNVPGFGVSWGWGQDDDNRKSTKVKSLSPSISVDYSFRVGGAR